MYSCISHCRNKSFVSLMTFSDVLNSRHQKSLYETLKSLFQPSCGWKEERGPNMTSHCTCGPAAQSNLLCLTNEQKLNGPDIWGQFTFFTPAVYLVRTFWQRTSHSDLRIWEMKFIKTSGQFFSLVPYYSMTQITLINTISQGWKSKYPLVEALWSNKLPQYTNGEKNASWTRSRLVDDLRHSF